MPSEVLKKALKDGLLTQKQYDKLPEALLEGIVKSKRAKGGKTTKSKPAGEPPKKRKRRKNAKRGTGTKK